MNVIRLYEDKYPAIKGLISTQGNCCQLDYDPATSGLRKVSGNVSDTPNWGLMLARYPMVSKWCLLKDVWIVSRNSPDGCPDGVWTVSR